MERNAKYALWIGAIVALLLFPMLFAGPLVRLWDISATDGITGRRRGATSTERLART